MPDKPVLLAAYQRWAEENHETALSARTFNARIAELPGVNGDGKSNSVRYWRGIGLSAAADRSPRGAEGVHPLRRP